MTVAQQLGKSPLQAGQTIVVKEVKKEVTETSLSFIRLLIHLFAKGTITTLICFLLLVHRGMMNLPWQLKVLLGLGGGFFPQSTLVQPETNQLVNAIVGQESGGNCSAVNPDSGALGYGQVMPENLGPSYNWGTQTVGYNVTPDQFLADCELQMKIIGAKIQCYYDEGLAETGNTTEANRYAAAKWYSGDGWLKDSTVPQVWDETGVEYPSISSYADQVVGRIGQGQGLSHETNEVQTIESRETGAVTITIQWPKF